MFYWNQRGGISTLYKAIFVLEVVATFSLFFIIRVVKVNGFVIVSLFWLLMAPVIIYWGEDGFNYFSFIVLWPLMFLSAYVFVRDNPRFFKMFNYVFLGIFIITSLIFLKDRMSVQSVIDGGMRQINVIFFPLLTLPWIMSLKSKKLRAILFLVLFSVTLISIKRSAILIMGLTSIPFIIMSSKVFKKYKYLNVIILIVIVSVFVYSFIKMNEYAGGSIITRMEAMADDGGSGRLSIYREVIEMQRNSSLEGWILGHGHYSVMQESSRRLSAHNDFLEILYSYGAIVFVLYLVLWWTVLRKLWNLYRRKHPLFLAYLSSVIIFLIMSMVSHLVQYASYFIFLVVFWGAIEGLEDSKDRCNQVSDFQI